MEALLSVEFAITLLTSDSRGVAPFNPVLGALPTAPIDFLDGMHHVESAQTFVDGLHQAISKANKNLQ